MSQDTSKTPTEKGEFEVNPNEAGCIWIKTKKGSEETFLSILLDKEQLNAFKTKDKPNDRSPDYNVIKFKEDNTSDLVGAAWVGETKQGREKLTLKIGDVYFTAVMRDEVDGQAGKRADMTIFRGDAAKTEES